MTTPETTHFGLTRIGQGEQYSKNGYSFSDLDRVVLDKILYAAITHSHDGSNRLADPDPGVVPGLAPQPIGGSLPAGTTFYYRVSLVDKYGLETRASSESSVVTPPPLTPPSAPAANVEVTSGTISAGVWSYQVTYLTSSGGETTVSPTNAVTVPEGLTNRIALTLPSLPSGASGYRIYRQRPGQTSFYYLDQTAAVVYYDTGISEDPTMTAPMVNTTNSTNAIRVTIPGNTIPVGCAGWKIYRAMSSGTYNGTSLVHYVVEGSSDTATDVLTNWLDTGDSLLQGFPKEVSSAVPGGTVVNLGQVTGTIPLDSSPRGSRILSGFAPGLLTDGRIITKTNTPIKMRPLRLTAYFQSPPSDASAEVRIRVSDSSTTPKSVELVCPPPTNADQTPGYYELDFPNFLGQTYEAEEGTRSILANMPIVTDVAASNGQAMEVRVKDEYIEQNLGVLSPGQYQMFATVRVPVYATTNADDLIIQAIRVSDNSVLAQKTHSPGISNAQSANYLEYDGPMFTNPISQVVALRVLKSTNVTQTYWVDTYRYEAEVPELAVGNVTVSAHIVGTNTSASDANISLWF